MLLRQQRFVNKAVNVGVKLLAFLPPRYGEHRDDEGGRHEKTTLKQRTTNLFAQETHLLTWIEAFLFDRRAQGLTLGTVEFYRRKLLTFTKFCESQAITQIDQIDPNSIRFFLIHLEDTNHNPGGVHAHYRTLKTFLFWWENEVEPEDWKNPIRKVKAPKVDLEPTDPVPIETIRAMLSICERQTLDGDRDLAIFLTLADTGVRAGELPRGYRPDMPCYLDAIPKKVVIGGMVLG